MIEPIFGKRRTTGMREVVNTNAGGRTEWLMVVPLTAVL